MGMGGMDQSGMYQGDMSGGMGGGYGKGQNMGGYDMGKGKSKGKGKKGKGKGKGKKGKSDIFRPGADDDRVVPKLTDAEAKEARTIVVKAQIAAAEKDDMQGKVAAASAADLQAMINARFAKSTGGSGTNSAASSPAK